MDRCCGERRKGRVSRVCVLPRRCWSRMEEAIARVGGEPGIARGRAVFRLSIPSVSVGSDRLCGRWGGVRVIKFVEGQSRH
jgi:hypothetical protein